MQRRNCLQILPILAAPSSWAQGTEKTVRLVAPFPPGGGADTLARLIASLIASDAPVIVENKAGAGGSLAATDVAKARSESMLLATAAIMAINPKVYRKLSYDPVSDFEPVVMICNTPLVVVASPSVKATNLAEFIQASKENTGKYFFASSGNGTIAHMSVLLLNDRFQSGFTHVPFNGEAPVFQALMSNEQPMAYFATLPGALPLLRSGRLKALGVGTVARNALIPAVPTLTEQGLKNVDPELWYGIVLPKTQADRADHYEKLVMAAFAQSAAREKVESLGYTVQLRGRGAFKKKVLEDIDLYGALAKTVNLQLD